MKSTVKISSKIEMGPIQCTIPTTASKTNISQKIFLTINNVSYPQQKTLKIFIKFSYQIILPCEAKDKLLITRTYTPYIFSNNPYPIFLATLYKERSTMNTHLIPPLLDY